jgi:hypothetical protein
LKIKVYYSTNPKFRIELGRITDFSNVETDGGVICAWVEPGENMEIGM